MSRESRREERLKRAREASQIHGAEANKPTLPKSVYADTLIGKLAMSLVGDEDASEMFRLLLDFVSVKMSSTQISLEGLTGQTSMSGDDLLPDNDMPVMFAKPYSHRTMRIVEYLEKQGYIKLSFRNPRGCGYNVVPPPREERKQWFLDAMASLEQFVTSEV